MRTGTHALRYVAAELGVDASTNVTIAGDGSGAVADV
jgi:hypothetical protein